MKTLIVLLLTSLALLVGCKTSSPSQRLSKETRVSVSVETDDLLYTQVLVGESAVQGVAKRIERQIINYLNQHGIQTVTPDAVTANDAKLTVKLNSIEMVATRDSAPFSPTFMRQQPIIRYNATLSGNGVIQFNHDYHHDDESLDKLTRITGETVAKRVVERFK